jgi:N-methylhydantoinase A
LRTGKRGSDFVTQGQRRLVAVHGGGVVQAHKAGVGVVDSPGRVSDYTAKGERRETRRMLHLAVDVGGTFTDICLFDDRESATRVAKVSSTRDPIDAVFEGIGEMDIALGEISLFSHGTTVATNALITRSFPRAAMVTTRGFRDVTEIRRGTKQDLWDAYEDVAPPYIRRRDRFEVAERVDYAGEELEPVNEDDVRRTAHLIERRGIETVAV